MKKVISIIISALLFLSANAQEEEKEKKYSANGYITNMQSFMMWDGIDGTWVNDNLIHNRLNFKWFPSEMFSVTIEARNRFFTGDQVRTYPDYDTFIEQDKGIIDMNWNIFSEPSFILNSQIDRAYVNFEKGNLNISLGRQRINWGRSFAWNPNDLFNSYSFFDFDYPEKPGSDAARIQYYTSETSSAELVAKTDSSQKVSAAGLYKFALGGYDIQFLGGMINEQDYVIGTGWEGNISSVSFKGEASYLHPKESFSDTSGVFVASASLSYYFSNSLMLQFEFLYNQQIETRDFASYYYQPASVKTLSFTEYNIFGNVSYPLTPLLNASLSAMYFPELNGLYAGPTLTYSLADNLDFAFIAQTFYIPDFQNPYTLEEDLKLTFAFLQLKYNF
jgi:hypothetical protein